MEQEQQSALTGESLNNISTMNTPGIQNFELSSIQSLLKKAFEIYKKGFWKFIGMMFVPVLGALPLVVILSFYVALKFLANGDSVAVNVVSVFLILLGLITLIIFVYIGFVSQTGLLILVGGGLTEISVKDAFLKARKYVWKLIVINFSVAVFVFLWGLLFIIPGVIVAVTYTYAQWSFFYEGFTGTAALKRSKELVSGYWGDVFIRSIGLHMILYFILFIISKIIGDGVFGIAWSIVSQIISFVVTPFFMIVSSLVFQELKEIKGESKIENKKGSSVGVLIFIIVFLVFVIWIFSTLVISSLGNAREKALDAKIVSDAKMTQTSLEIYFSENGNYPTTLNDVKDPLLSGTELFNYKQTPNGYQICFELKNKSGLFNKGKNCLTNE